MHAGEKIKNKLIEKGISRKQLSEMTGISEAAICRYINGTREPKIICLNSIANALDVPISYFIDCDTSFDGDLEDAISLIARNAKTISLEQKKRIINALMGL